MNAFLNHVNWQVFIAFVLAVFTIISYVHTRRRELAWKRTEFLCAQSQYMDNDPILVEVVTILEGRHAEVTTAHIFEGDAKIDPAQQLYLQKFDKLFNFLWRMSYAYLTMKTLSLREIEAFGWYFYLISESPAMVKYCDDNGFEEINIATGRLKRLWEKEEGR